MKNSTGDIKFILVGARKRQARWIVVTSLLTLLTIGLCIAMLMLGHTIYPVQDVFRALLGEQVPGVSFTISELRLPRMLAGLFAGFAFGIAGYVFQTILRNPLANPNVLGISSGSSAAAVLCIIVFHTSQTVVSIASIVGGLATVLVIYFLAQGRAFSIGRLILIGIGMQAMLDAFISYLLIVSEQQDIPAALRWLNGSLNGVQSEELPPMIITVLIFTVIVLFCGKSLTMLELGEQTAASLGVATDRTRIILIISTVLMLAMATATTGPIAFICFLAGPITNRLVGSGVKANSLPAGLVGASLVLAADLVGQFAFAYRFPVGVLTGLVGAPYLIWLLIRMNRKGEL